MIELVTNLHRIPNKISPTRNKHILQLLYRPDICAAKCVKCFCCCITDISFLGQHNGLNRQGSDGTNTPSTI